jgi:transposase InsO family protein
MVRGKHRTVTTRQDRSAPRHPDLVHRGWNTPTRVDELWVADFSYVWTLAGFVYVAFVVDVFSRRILGWRVSTSREATLVTDAFRHALATRRWEHVTWTSKGLIHHSDAGSQGEFNRSSQHLDREVKRWEQPHGRSGSVRIEDRSRHRDGPRSRGGRTESRSGRLSLAA